MIEFFDKDEDYKPIRLGGTSPAAKLFLADLKVRSLFWDEMYIMSHWLVDIVHDCNGRVVFTVQAYHRVHIDVSYRIGMVYSISNTHARHDKSTRLTHGRLPSRR